MSRHAEQILELARYGMVRPRDLDEQNIPRHYLRSLVESGKLQQISRGIYRLASVPMQDADLAIVASRVGKGVVCLVSALSFHQLTDQIAAAVWVALPRGSQAPRLDFPPLQVQWMSGSAYAAGIETYAMDGASVRVYSAPKTIADCFKYRNKVGLDVAINALNTWLKQPGRSIDELWECAGICRVQGVIRPYMEAATVLGVR